MMTRIDALEFAAGWIEAWNRRDVDWVLATFEDNVAFTSPTALAVVGVDTVRGMQALREYWDAALAPVSSLRFVMDRAIWDPETRELAIVYISEVNGETKRVSENLRFGQTGKVEAAEVFHGVPVG